MSTAITRPSVLRIYGLETLTEIRKVTRVMGYLLPTLLFPWMFYVFFGLIFNRGGFGGQMPTYLLATYGTFGIIAPALFSFGVGVAIEKGQGWMDIKQASPMPPMAYIWARVVSCLLFSFVVVCGLFVLGALFGEVRLFTSQWVLLAVTLVLCSLPFCAMGLAMGLFLKPQVAAGRGQSDLSADVRFCPDSGSRWTSSQTSCRKWRCSCRPITWRNCHSRWLSWDMGLSIVLHLVGVAGGHRRFHGAGTEGLPFGQKWLNQPHSN